MYNKKYNKINKLEKIEKLKYELNFFQFFQFFFFARQKEKGHKKSQGIHPGSSLVVIR